MPLCPDVLHLLTQPDMDRLLLRKYSPSHTHGRTTHLTNVVLVPITCFAQWNMGRSKNASCSGLDLKRHHMVVLASLTALTPPLWEEHAPGSCWSLQPGPQNKTCWAETPHHLLTCEQMNKYLWPKAMKISVIFCIRKYWKSAKVIIWCPFGRVL